MIIMNFYVNVVALLKGVSRIFPLINIVDVTAMDCNLCFHMMYGCFILTREDTMNAKIESPIGEAGLGLNGNFQGSMNNI